MGALDYKTRRHRRNRLAAELAATYSPRRHFRLGQDIGWHWQFDNTNDLYRRRNRLTYTRDFPNAAWTKTNILSVTSDADGVGDLVVPNATSSSHNISQAGVAYSTGNVMRVRAKAGGYNFIAIRIGLDAYAHFNVSAGTVGTLSGATGEIAAAADAPGYYDCTCMTTSAVAGANALIYVAAVDGVLTFTGDGTSGVYIARAQLETYTTTPTEYQDVPTTWAQAYLDAVGAERIYAWKDTAGTDPVTAVGDGIGLLLGREYGGARGPELKGAGAVGLVGAATVATYSTSTGVGTATRVDAANQSFVVLSGFGAFGMAEVTLQNTGATVILVRITDQAGAISVTVAAGATTSMRVATAANGNLYITAGSGATGSFTIVSARAVPGTHLIQATGTAKPTLSARVNLLLNTATMSTQNVTTVATIYKLSFTGTGTVTLSGTSTAGPLVGTGANHRVSLTFTPTAGTLTLTVSGSVTLADLRTADDAAKNLPAYQRVGATASDHDTDGFPHYALADGTDDAWASVATVDGSATDKLTVVAAVTKNSDAAISVVLELTSSLATQNGSFAISAPDALATANYGIYTRGTTNSTGFVATTFAAPVTSVVDASIDNGGAARATQIFPRVNGAIPTLTGAGAAAAGAGNFANATLHVLSRAGTSLRFNGRFYGSTGRFGSMSDSERNSLTHWWQKRIGTA